MPECHLTHPSKPQPLPSHSTPIGRWVSSSSGWINETRNEVELGVRRMGRGRVDRTEGEVAWSASRGCCWLMGVMGYVWGCVHVIGWQMWGGVGGKEDAAAPLVVMY